jgi:hypothetical protein
LNRGEHANRVMMSMFLLHDESQPLITMLMLDSGAGYTVSDYTSNRPSMLYKDNIRAIYPISAIVSRKDSFLQLQTKYCIFLHS